MKISDIVSDISENGCCDYFVESYENLSLESSEIRSLSTVIDSFTKTFLENSGFNVKNRSYVEDGILFVENIISTRNGISLGKIRHSIKNGSRSQIHFVEDTDGIMSKEFIEKMRNDGKRIVKRFLKTM